MKLQAALFVVQATQLLAEGVDVRLGPIQRAQSLR
jgi:hypothetical protein